MVQEAEWKAKEDNERIEEQAVKSEEERAHAAKEGNGAAANDAEASLSGVPTTSSNCNKEIIFISSSDDDGT
jgi:hypothetical protein